VRVFKRWFWTPAAAFVHIMADRAKVSLKVLPKKADNLLFLVNSTTTSCVSQLTLRNKSKDVSLVYKIKTNCSDRYWTEPKSGVLLMGQTMVVQVELRPEFIKTLLGQEQASDSIALITEMETNDKFLISCVSLLESEQEELTAKTCHVNDIFERAKGTPAVLNTKRSVKVNVDLPSPDPAVVMDQEEEEEEEQNGNSTTTTPTPTIPTPTPPPTTAPTIKAVSPTDLLSAAKLHTSATPETTTETPSSSAKELAAATAQLNQVVQNKEKKIQSLQNRLLQTEQQLKQSVEQHRTARRSLDALRKSAQETVAREKLMARSSVGAGKSKGPSSELLKRSPDHWTTMDGKGHPNIVRAYPLSYVPGPVAYFVLCWFLMVLLSYFL
jgi:hypothetical protein